MDLLLSCSNSKIECDRFVDGIAGTHKEENNNNGKVEPRSNPSNPSSNFLKYYFYSLLFLCVEKAECIRRSITLPCLEIACRRYPGARKSGRCAWTKALSATSAQWV